MTGPTRVAYLTSVYPRATDTFIRSEVEQLRLLGWDVRPFSVRRPSARELVSEEVREESRRTFYLLGAGVLRLAFAAAAALVRSPRRMAAALRLAFRTGAPGVRARVRQVAYLLEAALLAREMRRLGVTHLHNHIAEASASVALLASTIGGIPWSLTVHGPGIFFAPRLWALGEKIARSAFTACISEFCRSQCMVFAPPSAWERLKVVRCGLDPRLLAAPATPVPEEPRLVCVGRLCPEKGQLLLLEAVRRLAGEGTRVEVEIIGDGEGRPEIEAAIRRLGLGERVRLSGFLSSEQVFERIRASRALVLPSFAEGLPVVLMEALALRRPVIATRIAGVPELVEPGVSGWLVPPSSVDGLVAAMREAATAPPDALLRMGCAGAARVAERHDAAVEARKLGALFRQAPGPLSGGPQPATAAAAREGARGGEGQGGSGPNAEAPSPEPSPPGGEGEGARTGKDGPG